VDGSARARRAMGPAAGDGPTGAAPGPTVAAAPFAARPPAGHAASSAPVAAWPAPVEASPAPVEAGGPIIGPIVGEARTPGQRHGLTRDVSPHIRSPWADSPSRADVPPGRYDTTAALVLPRNLVTPASQHGHDPPAYLGSQKSMVPREGGRIGTCTVFLTT
jgi:hypothetical protein